MPSSRHSSDTDVSRGAVAALSQPHLGLSTAGTSCRPCGLEPRARLEPGHGEFADQLLLELGQAPRRCRTRGGRPRSWCRSARPGPASTRQAHARWARFRPSRSSFQTTSTSPLRLAPVVADAGGEVVVEVGRVVDARGPQGVALQVQRLGAVGLRDAGVGDQHVSQTALPDAWAGSHDHASARTRTAPRWEK